MHELHRRTPAREQIGAGPSGRSSPHPLTQINVLHRRRPVAEARKGRQRLAETLC
jgi:hypothetical protein